MTTLCSVKPITGFFFVLICSLFFFLRGFYFVAGERFSFWEGTPEPHYATG